MIAAGFLVQTPLQTSTHTGLDWRLLNPARRVSNLKCVLGPWQHAEGLARYAEGLLNCEGQGAYSGGGRVAAAASDRLAGSSSAGCRINAQQPLMNLNLIGTTDTPPHLQCIATLASSRTRQHRPCGGQSRPMNWRMS